ncbi:MAG TPA: glycosyltransferase family 2 protein [Usitatibacter sp.]|nr:glycosyltransferase family 2 protein [Usitatibacter sp.]
MLSITVPIYNEAQNLEPLHQRLVAALEPLGQPFEVVLVNDGSTDGSDRALDALAARDSRVKVVHLRRNYGQTAAMMAGIRYASGEIIIPMDGDLQNDPADIPKLLAKLDEGFDVVSGWRKDRKDAAIRRNFLSRVANHLISRISGVRLHDYGCSLKAYRRDVVKGVKLYGEMHRFIPIYATWEGGKVAEVVVSHHPRVHGQSKYGVDRVVKVLLDLIVVQFLARYASRPIYLFGGCGVASLLLALVAGLWAVYLKYFEATSFIQTPLPLLVVLLTLTGGISILMGLLAEIIMRTYYESQGKAVYDVRSTANLGPDPS